MPGVARSGRRCLGGLGFLRWIDDASMSVGFFFPVSDAENMSRYGLKMAEVPK